jgi:hypothetical protein
LFSQWLTRVKVNISPKNIGIIFLTDFNIFLNAVSEERFMYSSSMMFYFVRFLEETKSNSNQIESEIRYNYYKMLLNLLNNTIKL